MKTKQARAIWYKNREKTIKRQQQLLEEKGLMNDFELSKYKTMGSYIRYHLKISGYGIN